MEMMTSIMECWILCIQHIKLMDLSLILQTWYVNEAMNIFLFLRMKPFWCREVLT